LDAAAPNCFNPVVRCPQASLALERDSEGFRIRRFDGATGRENVPHPLTARSRKSVRRSFALVDILVGAAHELQQRRLILARHGWRLHRQ